MKRSFIFEAEDLKIAFADYLSKKYDETILPEAVEMDDTDFTEIYINIKG